MREVEQLRNPDTILTSSESEDEAENDPGMRLLLKFEEHLKKRIFLADRIEKVEKALVSMNLIAKEVHYCSDFEFARFKDAINSTEALEQISQLIQLDSEDVWFDLYRTITSSKEMAERQVEK